MKTLFLANSIFDTPEANEYLNLNYGTAAQLIPVSQGKKTKFKFINVQPMRNYKYAFKTVAKAMNCLLMHENGYVASRIKERKDIKRMDRMMDRQMNCVN